MTPPASICAPALIAFEGGSGSLRVRIDDNDQLTAAIRSATAPAVSIDVPRDEWLISTATPAMPINNATASRDVNVCVRSRATSKIVMKAGMVDNITAAIPEGTRCSAQNNNP